MTDLHAQIGRLIEVGRHRAAVPLLKELLSGRPDDPDGHVLAARIAWAENNKASAHDHVGRALARSPSHRGARLIQFFLLLDDRRYPEAEQSILSLLHESPADSDLLAFYARLMIFTAHLDKADGLITESLRHDPENHEARLLSVLVSTVRGERARAQEQLADLIVDDPDGHRTAWTLFTVLMDQSRHREALRVGQQLLRHHPDDAALTGTLIDLRASTHWLSLPAWPLNRWGWGASGAIWMVAIVIMAFLRGVSPRWAGIFAFTYIAWAVYTWIHRPLLKRWVAWRGIA